MEQLPAETTVYSLSNDPPRDRRRRSGERHIALFRVAALISCGQRELCLLKNISAGGALIRAYSDLSEGQAVAIEINERETIPGRVSWVREADAGIAFDRKIDVLALLSADGRGPKPRIPRVAVRAFAFVRQGAVLHRASISNISQGGLCVGCDSPLTIGGNVTVSIHGLPPQPAVVRWGEAGSYGISFNTVIGLPMLVAWLRSQGGSAATA